MLAFYQSRAVSVFFKAQRALAAIRCGEEYLELWAGSRHQLRLHIQKTGSSL
jgi:hypothetical protein